MDEDRASILSGSYQSSVKQKCFMLDALFKVRMDVFKVRMDMLREGRDLQKGSQVVAGDGKTVLEVVEISKEGPSRGSGRLAGGCCQVAGDAGPFRADPA